MAASRTFAPLSPDPGPAPASARRFGQWLVLVALVGSVLAACGRKMDVPMPDIATKSTSTPNGGKPLTAAEQQRAIDAMIAKRDQDRVQTR